MAGLDKNMLKLIECLSKNQIQAAKEAAIACCANDSTKKNEHNVKYYTKLLKNGNAKMMELPYNIVGLLQMQDVSDFHDERYYVGNMQQELFDKIVTGTKITEKLLEYGIPYRNTTLIHGIPGTGKTEFAKYVAYKLNLPYAYLNFSQLIDSYLGKTAQNLQRVFDYCKGQKCVLMLDEIDCIGIRRSHDTGADGELGRTTIALMQCLDSLVDGQIVIAATNRPDRLDKALARRFRTSVEFEKFDFREELNMIQKFVDAIDVLDMTQEMVDFAKSEPTQAETFDFMIDKIAEKVVEETKETEEAEAVDSDEINGNPNLADQSQVLSKEQLDEFIAAYKDCDASKINQVLDQITVDQLQALQKKQMSDFLDAWENRDMQKLYQLLDQNREMRKNFTKVLKNCPYQAEMAAARIAQTEKIFEQLCLQDTNATSENSKK